MRVRQKPFGKLKLDHNGWCWCRDYPSPMGRQGKLKLRLMKSGAVRVEVEALDYKGSVMCTTMIVLGVC